MEAYRSRLSKLVETSRHLGARVVLVTQPALYGEGIDDRTGLDLSRIYVDDVDGATAWTILERYNEVTRAVADELSLPLIDLARELKKSSYLFYDTIHFTNAGSEEVARILYPSLCAQLALDFPGEPALQCPETADPRSR